MLQKIFSVRRKKQPLFRDCQKIFRADLFLTAVRDEVIFFG